MQDDHEIHDNFSTHIYVCSLVLCVCVCVCVCLNAASHLNFSPTIPTYIYTDNEANDQTVARVNQIQANSIKD